MTDLPRTPATRPVAGFVIAGVLLLGAGAAVPVLRAQRESLAAEAAALRAAQAGAVQLRDSLQGLTGTARATLALERARAGARAEPKLHLVIAVDSGTVALVRDGITLRSMPARFRGGAPATGSQTIARMIETAPEVAAPTVDSLGNRIAAPPAERKVQRVALSDGTHLEGGDAAAALLGGTEPGSGPRTIIISRRDFNAIRPNLVRGMPVVLF
ncbi:MAG: hypothetical protein IT355_00510 [Gemmatimonadaceae bacterium]|nr:hypothetical protein [Gemmatimonadaceae bacterium]